MIDLFVDTADRAAHSPDDVRVNLPRSKTSVALQQTACLFSKSTALQNKFYSTADGLLVISLVVTHIMLSPTQSLVLT